MGVMALRTLSVFVGLLFLLSGCDNGDKKEVDGSVKELIMITSGDNPPYEFLDIQSGESRLIGFDMDLVDQLSERMNVSIKKINADFSAIIPSLLSGRADFAAAGLTITEERKKNVDFSVPYLIARVAVVYKKETEPLSSKNLSGKRIGVQLGAVHEDVVKKIVGQNPPAVIVSYNQLAELVQELKSGRLDGVVMDYMPARYFSKENPNLVYQYLEGGDVEYSLAFPKGSPWVEKFNKVIEEFIQDPSYETLRKKWFKEQ